ncbi:ATP-dependent DNA helicase [Carnimonas nigrificans]|uniref:ATP-dependent DNA helicase n=1 Tax=Carnimonas nigrificans TaxID=64323 RepID=UPI0004713D31|nr:ATP-dependent DNA helicase [Carnimonas nigrificans]
MSYSVAVRALSEFVARHGDLDLRFTPSPSSLEGIEGHARVVERRAEEYQAELVLSGEYQDLVVRGRADGFDSQRRRLEEIKTHRGALDRQPVNHRALHWAQVKLYGWLACEHFGFEEIELALIYFDIERDRETPLVQRFSRDELSRFFEQCCEQFLGWARQESAHRQQRDDALRRLAFPKSSFRPGQRDLAESVYKAARLSRPLLLQAPTGIGKTLGTLFPMLKAVADGDIDRLFFLTARTTGRQLALEGVREMNRGTATPLRTLELIARDKACEHPDLACHGESCPLAQGFYDRLPEARRWAVEAVARDGILLDRQHLRDIALTFSLCPYYFGQEMARWSDVVVGDYNHYFGLGGMLFVLAQQQRWKPGVLLDEAHNLVERGRSMFSAELSERSVKALAGSVPRGLGNGFKRLACTFSQQREQLDEEQQRGQMAGVMEQLPTALASEVKRVAGRIGEYLAEHPEQPLEGPLMRFYFDALRFEKLLERYDPRYFQWEFERSFGRYAQLTLRLRNVIPGPWLSPRFTASAAVTLFSATLAPGEYFRTLLGLPEQTLWRDIASPFDARQLDVHVISHISTRYHDRAQSVGPLAALIAAQVTKQQGNYLAFFSSFDYMERVTEQLARLAPDIPLWKQQRHMDEEERGKFIERFREGGHGVGFAVLGGVFAEGIDLVGGRLIGAFIATLGLPQFNPFNQALRRRFATLYGSAAGYRYAYLYPGLTKVVQAAGRVIRSEQDQGQIWLIDDRFTGREVQALLPRWWDISR